MAEQPFNRGTGDLALDEDIVRLYRRIASLESRLQASEAQIDILLGRSEEEERAASGDTIETLSAGLPIPAQTLIVDDTTGLTLEETGGGVIIGVDTAGQINTATAETVTTLEDIGIAFRRLLVNLVELFGGEFLDDVLLPHYERGIGEK